MKANDVRLHSPLFRMLSDRQIEEIHGATLYVMERTGCVIHNGEALALLKKAGAFVDGNRAYIKASLVEKAINSAPSHIVLYNRHGQAKMFLGGQDSYFGTGSDTLFIYDPYTGERRKYTQKDVENITILSDHLPEIDFIMSMGLISDVPLQLINQYQYSIMFKNSTKPQVVVTDNADSLKDVIDMASAVVGGLEALQRKPIFLLYAEPSSPLVHSQDALDKLILMAEYGLPTNYAAGTLGGGTTPITIAGSLIQLNAEMMAGLVVNQLKREGAPFVYGSGNSPMELKSMQPAYCSPEKQVFQAAYCDIARYYRLPTWGYAGCSVSKVCDEQAAIEASTYIFTAALSGCNVNHDVGYLDFGLASSMELVAICNEIIREAKAFMKGVDTNPEYQALDAIDRVGPGGHFMGDEHTFNHFKECWLPELTDRSIYEHWSAAGKKTMFQRANEKVRQVLETYKPEPLPQEAEAEIDRIVERARVRIFGGQ